MATAQWAVSTAEKHAGHLVLAAWMLLLVTFALAATIGVQAVLMNFYHPMHRGGAYDEAIISTLWAALALGLFAAVAGSAALLLRQRLLAAGIIVAAWAGVLGWSVVSFVEVEPRPDTYIRYVGDERFVVPWTFEPRGSEEPNPNGLSLRLCAASLRGGYDPACDESRQAAFRPASYGIERNFDVSYWLRRREEMRRLPDRYDHQVWELTDPPRRTTDGEPVPSSRSIYYVRYDADGRLVRLADCSETGHCGHVVLLGGYLIEYRTNTQEEFSRWRDLDSGMLRLLASWRSP